MAHFRLAQCEGLRRPGKGIIFRLLRGLEHQTRMAVGEALAPLSLTS